MKRKKKIKYNIDAGKNEIKNDGSAKPQSIKKSFFLILIIGVLTAAAFSPSLTNDFADLDDSAYVMNNKDITDFSVHNMKAVFTKGYVGHYCPATMISYAVDYHFFKLKPFGYHLTNLILHILVTFMVFYFIFLVSKRYYIAFIAGLFFGVHPLHVESVAWIAERKDVLCAFFYMVTLILYSFYLEKRKKRFMALCLMSAVLALLAKPMAVTIPVVFFVMDFYHRRINFFSVLEKVPFFALSIAAGLVNIHFQTQAGAIKVFAKGWEAVYFLTMAPLFYLYKLIWPLHLSAMYGYYNVPKERFFLIPVFGGILIMMFAAVVFSLKYSRKIFFGCSISFIMLLPVLKIIPVGDIYAADRYMYLPSIGLLYIAGIFFNFLVNRYNKKTMVNIAVAFITAFFMILTWQRCLIWRNPTVFYEETLKTAPDSQVLLNNLGNIYMRSDRVDEAIDTYRRSIALIPDDPGSHYNLGNALFEEGRVTDSVEAYKEALRLRPDFVDAYKFLARSYHALGKKKKEIEVYKKIIEIRPAEPTSYYNLCLMYRNRGNMSEAERYCDLAVKYGMKAPPGLIAELSRYNNADRLMDKK